MTLVGKLVDFSGSVLTATDAPDEYSRSRIERWGSLERAYEENKAMVYEAMPN